MTGTIEQMIALVSYGNHFLKSNQLPEAFYPGNPAFRYTKQMDFRDVRKKLFSRKLAEKVIANDPLEWFRFLKKMNCKGLFINNRPSADQSKGPDHKLAGFVGGGGSWMIESMFDFYSSFWAQRMEVTNQDDHEQKIWSVNYGRTLLKCRPSMLKYSVEENRALLSKNLEAVISFTDDQKLTNWNKIFRDALDCLHDPEPEKLFYNTKLIVPELYSVSARQLLVAAGRAFVFGGMGSWNDINFSEHEIAEAYENLSKSLYESVCQSIVAATNDWS